jgi:hypothetical protein
MKNFITLILISVALLSCNKRKACEPSTQNTVSVPTQQNFGPYGKESTWLSIGGDTTFTDTLTLIHFYTEIATPCNICYYKQNISFWNDYDYTYSVSECAVPRDTLVFTDIDSPKKTIFKRLK